MSIYSSRALGSTGVIGAFNGGGRSIFGPFTFAESWSSDDFGTDAHFNQWVKPNLDQVDRKGMSYDPPSSSILTRASAAWSAWKAAQDLGVVEADTYIANTTSQMKSLIARADELSLTTKGWPFVASREEKIEVQRYDVFAQIVSLIKKVAGSKAKADAYAAAATAAGAVASPGAPDMPTAGSVTLRPTGVSADTTSGTGKNRSMATAAPSNMMLYVGLGVGAVVLIGGALYVKRRKASMAGYRRRGKRLGSSRK